ncbi:MAG: hypothetical protein OEZ08_18515 [Betaproteobacteria bacterium]|nr:hypothetical protein [Betaproteobacteria bacterium]
MKAKLAVQGQRTSGSTAETRTGARFARLAAVAALPVIVLSGCYVMPIGQDAAGNPHYIYSTAPVAPTPRQPGGPLVVPGGPMPAALNVKLYPINDLANQTGVLTGQVTNMMTGKGRFTFNYQGETLVGEATRVDNDHRRGVASAYGPRGMFARCEYQMSSPTMGAGTCTFSNNAMYQAHIGN